MSLNWNISEIKDSDALCWREVNGETQLAPTTECMIWATMIVDIGEITEKNAMRFAERLYQWETIVGTISSDGERLTFADVKAHIGLRTNVITTSDAKWRKRISSKLEEKAREAVRK